MMNTKHRLSVFVGIVALMTSGSALAQKPVMSAQEYIQSTSPLAGGGSVTSIAQPGQSVQTIATIASLPPATAPQQPTVATGFTPRGNAPIGTGVIAQPYGSQAGAVGTNTRYAYPSSNQPTMASPINTNTMFAATATAPGGTVANNTSQFSARDYQNQALAAAAMPRPVTNTSYRQNNPAIMATPTGQFNYGVQYGQTVPNATQANYQVPAASAGVPQINIQVPGQTATMPGTNVAGTVPSLNSTVPVNYQNMPPGYYSGKNISGKVKNYVDGQAIRNLFRFITP
jgi:hypothetical protein